MRVLGFDPSLRNWGIAEGEFNPMTNVIQIGSLDVIRPVLPKGKQTRQNSKDIEAAYQLSRMVGQYIQGVQALFVEVPVGSQSARSMASYGICVGILGALRTRLPIYEVTPTEVKLSTVGSKTASKAQMINWATTHYPTAPWPKYSRNGKQAITEAKAEHMADAIGAIHAGITLPSFQQALAMRVA